MKCLIFGIGTVLISLFCILILQDIVPVDASYDVKELYVQENKLDLAKADAEILPAVQIGKVLFFHYLFLNLDG